MGFMSDLTNAAGSDRSVDVAEVRSKLNNASERKQLQLLRDLPPAEEASLDVFIEFLGDRRSRPEFPSAVDGTAYQLLYSSDAPKAIEFLQTHFPTGIVPLRSQRGIDYAPLQQLLVKREWQDADRVTVQKMCELAGESAMQRKWLYFTEVDNFPVEDLQTIDCLWVVHSEGKFGYSVQRELWLGVGKQWGKLWPKIAWKDGNHWSRYPNEFTWDLSAPKGHLPLSNQLRGVRVMNSLLNHPAIASE
jgi:hypothetical protein